MRSPLLKIWLLVVAIATFINLGAYPLYDADEGRNGEVGREMAATNDYVMPRLDGLPYLDKPVVYFAAEAAAMEVLGPTELAARLPAYLFTLLTAALVFWFARRVWGGDEAVIASIAFLSMPLTLAFARTVIFDSALTFFMTAATMSFYFACHPERSEGSGGAGAASDLGAPPAAQIPRSARNDSRKWSALAWAAIALGVLTKGPVAILVPLLIAIPYAIRRKAFRALWSIAGIVIFIAIIAPWVWAVSRVVPDFLHYVVVTETAQRLATKALKRTGPPWYFVPFVIGGALPWWISSTMIWRKRDEVAIFSALAVILPFLFFSISQSKRPQYILPVMPFIALLAARLWTTDERLARIAARAAAVVFLILGAAILCLPFVHVKMAPEIEAGAQRSAIPLGLATIAGGLAFIKRRELALIALTIPIISIPITAQPMMEAIAVRRSAKSFAAQLPADAKIVGIEDFTGSMAFYLRRPIDIVTPDAEELTSNYIIRHYEQFADRSAVRKTLNLQRGPVYIVRNNDAAHRAMLEQNGFRIIADSPHHVAYR